MQEYMCGFLDIPFAWIGLIVVLGVISYYGSKQILIRLSLEKSLVSDYVISEKEKKVPNFDYEFGEEKNERIVYGAIKLIIRNLKFGEYRPIHYVTILWPVIILAPIVTVGYYLFFVCYAF